MEIEKEIKNNKFINNYHKASVNILFTYNWLNSMLKKELNQHKITNQQFNILRILRGQYPNPCTVNILKERMLDKMSDASRIVDRLVQKELVTRNTNKKDRRSVDILISDKGLCLLENIHLEAEMSKILSQNISEKDCQHLSNLLDKLRG
ncbi:MarR family transcriptional regulator [Pedobacter sp. SD-b]|uniref:MarR family transcriptional regulator n=1 Tax=Pedobacter segetis TaxID=2793069 RepID=A0ABS1BJ65_9SPHI|nr:MarR family transcriptional regulator [Pedobacter segetis]MBK0382948.1 MarR family transcriptional regulator [Pedobacter segetis]